MAQDAEDPGTRIALWDNGVPGHEERREIAQVSREYWTRQVNDPAIVHFPAAAGTGTGASVVIMPGGAHEFLVTTTEGTDVARWFAARGVSAFVLYYRLANEEVSPWDIEDARQDAERAVRLIRARADQFALDPHKIGVMGFSAGGELARMTLLSPPVPPEGAGDALDRGDARPDFGILVFPGPMHGDVEDTGPGAPPLLLSAAADDECCSQPVIDIFLAYRAAGGSAELHIYQEGGHAYNMGEASDLVSLQRWPGRIEDWMVDRGLMAPRQP
ncbi:alpha/beta hydrolase fold domain-containing protein [Altererythrobacter aestuarii]|uniref:Alpha/beta hydrolase fold domain-containing protein n=1 Tax=Alteraurantiacibacter aestuarii TaxID=650004 RepID=A0A844ZIS3_9SPHN|nr:alpha/beta hydrolase fold domain-containing protein [Alteraurantiacibacter aestuarii]